MRLNQIHGDMLYHGVSPLNNVSVRQQLLYLVKNGFDKPHGDWAIYFSDINRALSYRRDLDFEDPDDQDQRGIIEIAKIDGNIDGDDILQNEPGSINVSGDLLEQWNLLYQLNKQWEDFDEDPMFNDVYINTFGDINPYTAAQILADKITAQSGTNYLSNNRAIKSGIAPDDIVGAYIFTSIGNNMFRCTEVIKNGTINLGDVFKMSNRC